MLTTPVHSDSNQINASIFALLESLPDAAVLIEQNGVILNTNAIFTSKFSKDTQQCTGANIYDLIANTLQLPELAAHLREKSEEVLRSAKRAVFEDKREIWRFTINPVLSPEREITRLFVTIQDISEQKHLEHELTKRTLA